jgi:hypothetical protein
MGLPPGETFRVDPPVLAEVRVYKIWRSEVLFCGDPAANPPDGDTSSRPSEGCFGVFLFGFFLLVFFGMMLLTLPGG